MIDRRTLGWLIALVVTGLACAGLAIWLLHWAAELQLQVNHWYTSQNGSNYDEVKGAFFDRIGSNAYSMETIASPLLAGTVIAILAAITVLARRWDLRR